VGGPATELLWTDFRGIVLQDPDLA
jgi:hypothetical protein